MPNMPGAGSAAYQDILRLRTDHRAADILRH